MPIPYRRDMAKPYVEIRQRGDNFYAYEREAYWDPVHQQGRNRTLRFLGPCDKHGRILAPPKVHLEAARSAFPVGRLLAFHASAEKLGVRERVRRVLEIDDEMAGHFMIIVYNMDTDRVADEHLPEWVRAGPLNRLLSLDTESLTPETFGRVRSALCRLNPDTKLWEDRGPAVQKALTRGWRSLTRDPPGAYYDVTKVEFHGWTNPYAEKGHDANGGISTVVGFGMVVSSEHHHPYLCRALPGSQNDSLGVGETIRTLRSWRYEGLHRVMDRGMITKENVKLSRDEGFPLVGLVRGWDLTTLALASRWSEEELEQPENVVETSRGSVYARALTTPLFGIPALRVAVVVNPRRKAEEREGRDLALDEWEGPSQVSRDRVEVLKKQLKVQNPKLRKKKGYAPGLLVKSVGRRGAVVDHEAVKRARGVDGRFLIFSTDLTLGGKEMYRTYFARDGIEKVFRTGKGELSLTPLRWHRQDRTDAHATIFHTASLLWSWSEQTLKRKYPELSLTEALRSLESLAWVRSGSGKSAREWPMKPNDEQKELLSALGAIRYLPIP